MDMTANRWYGLFVVACTTLVGTATPAYGQNGLGPWRVEYRTAALAVEDVKELGKSPGNGADLGVAIKVRNVSGKLITGIAVSGASPETITYAPVLLEGLKPDATYTLYRGLQTFSDEDRIIRILAVLFGDRSPDDGDPTAIEHMRFERLGGLFETTRCSAILNQFDPSRLEDTTIQVQIQKLNGVPEMDVPSLPEVSELQSRLEVKRRILGAGPDAMNSFARGVGAARELCQTVIKELMRPTACSVPPGERNRAGCLNGLKRDYESRISALRGLADRDLEVER